MPCPVVRQSANVITVGVAAWSDAALTINPASPAPARRSGAAPGSGSSAGANKPANGEDPDLAAFALAFADDAAGRALLEVVFGNSPFLGRCLLIDMASIRAISSPWSRRCLPRIGRRFETPLPPRKRTRAADHAGPARRRGAASHSSSRWPTLPACGALERVTGRAQRLCRCVRRCRGRRICCSGASMPATWRRRMPPSRCARPGW